MKVRYTGPSGTGVKVPHPDPAAPDTTAVTVCPPGEPVDLPDGVAAELIHAGTFEPVDRPKTRAKTTDQEGEG